MIDKRGIREFLEKAFPEKIFLFILSVYRTINTLFINISTKKNAREFVSDTIQRNAVDASIFLREGISIIIPTIGLTDDSNKLILDLIYSGEKANCEFEIIVVSQGEEANIDSRVVDSTYVKVLLFNDFLGFTGAVNEGARHALFRYFFILNDDLSLINKDLLAKIWTTLSSDKKIGYLSAVTVFPGKYLRGGREKKSMHVDGKELDVTLDEDGERLVINAGSNADGDIGFCKLQSELEPQNITSLCGACLVVNTKFLQGSDVFVQEQFAYYEDRYLTENYLDIGCNLHLYDDLIIEHKLSQTTGKFCKDSMVKRGGKIYRFLTSGNVLDFNHDNPFVASYSDLIGRKKLGIEFHSGKTKYKRVCIFNMHWSTRGGGERVALDFSIEISNNPYCIVYIPVFGEAGYQYLKSLNVDKHGIRIVRLELDEFKKNAQWFDVFFDFSFGNDYIPRGPKYIRYVHFPVMDLESSFEYLRIFNSNFSRDCAANSRINSKTIYPLIETTKSNHQTSDFKVNTLVLIGRFFEDGHCKNQHIAIQAFLESEISRKGWKLILIGRVSGKRNIKYLEKCQQLAHAQESIKFMLDITDRERDRLIQQSSCVLSCTGMNSKEKRLQEHFGIGVVEAMACGAYPIVYDDGGPKEIISKVNFGTTFDSYVGLVSILANLDRRSIEVDPKLYDEIGNIFGAQRFQSEVKALINKEF